MHIENFGMWCWSMLWARCEGKDAKQKDRLAYLSPILRRMIMLVYSVAGRSNCGDRGMYPIGFLSECHINAALAAQFCRG